MPFKSVKRFCLECRTRLHIRNTRDLTRRKFCGHSCRATYYGKRIDMALVRATACTPQANAKKSMPGAKNPRWRPAGSKRITRHGYIQIKVAEGGRWPYEHRVVAKARKGEVVHHRNEVRSDNHRSNLRKFQGNTEHLAFHRKKRTEFNATV